MGALSFSHSDLKGGTQKVLPCFFFVFFSWGGGGGQKFRTSDFPVLYPPSP